jgi:hypothetical protein
VWCPGQTHRGVDLAPRGRSGRIRSTLGRICATTIFRSAGSRHCGSSRSQKRTGACACFAALMPAGTAFGRAPIAALVSMEGIGAGAEAPPLRVSARD